MNKRIALMVAVPAPCAAGYVLAQSALLDMAANKVISKYQSASCDQLWAAKGAPKSPEEAKAIEFLHNDSQARTAFINKVAAPVANKMFECGMIP